VGLNLPIGFPERTSPLLEPFRRLRSNLEYLNVDHEVRVIMLSSALPRQGKTVTTINLALSLALSGERVIIVSGAPGSFAEFRRGVALLRQEGVPFVLRTALLPANSAELDDFDAWAGDLSSQVQAAGVVSLFDLRTRRDSAVKNERIRALRLPPEQHLALTQTRTRGYRAEKEAFCRRFMGPGGSHIFDCGAGRSFCLDAYGRLQACMLVRHPDTVYDLKSGSLKDALERFFPSLRERRARNEAYLERCARCLLHGLCEQCPGRSWSEHGTLDTPVEYLCALAHAEAAELGLLEPGERGWEVTDWKERSVCKPS
jgi:radical SAM protein with 4Fe4S-binding SPASM domain